MVKPQKKNPTLRRLITIPLYVVSWMLLTITAPIWLIAGVLIGFVRRRSFVVLRLFAFGWAYLGIAIVALIRIALSFTERSPEERQHRLFQLQLWWSALVLRTASKILRLHIEIQDPEAALPGPTVLLVRHASILDTLLSCVYIQGPAQWPMRYVLKQELLVDPCLDIVGNALPNYFVDRTGDRARELTGIRELVKDLGDEGVLIYPEGTRFSPQKLARARDRVREQDPELASAAAGLTHVLPPRVGGVLALLDALPEIDFAFFAHSGLESLAKVKDILSGAIVGSTVRGKVWRVPRSEIPRTNHERVQWLYEQWSRVNGFIREAEA